MTLADYFMSGRTVELLPAFLAVLVFLFAVLVRQKTQERITGLESRLESLAAKQGKKHARAEGTLASVKTELIEKAQSLGKDIDSVSRRAQTLFENDDQIRQDMEAKLVPIVEAMNAMDTKIAALQESLHGMILKDEEELNSMMHELSAYSEDNRKIKDFIRERTIDLEL